MQYLAGGAITVLKNMKVHGKDYPIYEMENKTCSKPPTRYGICLKKVYIYIYIYIYIYRVQVIRLAEALYVESK